MCKNKIFAQMINYYRLARLHQPIGIFLLWYPTVWALWIAYGRTPPLLAIIIFFLGTVLMRSAGCIINDIADRNIDLHVKRTQNRPLTAGQISLLEAFMVLLIFLVGALMILLCLPLKCFLYAFFALLITIIYPFTKRFFYCPQLFLGLAFSMGIPMAYEALNQPLNRSTFFLFILNFCWILAYDTEYALVDKADDILIGVKSTAIFFGKYDQWIIFLLHISMQLLWFTLVSPTSGFLIAWTAGGLTLIYQHRLLAANKNRYAPLAFRLNNYYGLILWLGIILK